MMVQLAQRRRLLFGLIAAGAVFVWVQLPPSPDKENHLSFAQDRGLRRLSLLKFTRVYRGNGDVFARTEPKIRFFDAPVNEGHGVKCCSDEANGNGLNWSKSPQGETWCPYAYNFLPEECSQFERTQLLNFQQANDFCASKGGRLCTAHELKGRCAVGNGCDFDLEMVWAYNVIDEEESEYKEDPKMDFNSQDMAPICMTGKWFGRSFNRFRQLAHMIEFSHQNGGRPIRLNRMFHKWSIGWWFDFDQRDESLSSNILPRITLESTRGDTQGCFHTKDLKGWHHYVAGHTPEGYSPGLASLHQIVQKGFFDEAYQRLNQYKEQFAEEQRTKGRAGFTSEQVQVATVHSRWLEGNCPGRIRNNLLYCSNALDFTDELAEEWAVNACSYTEGYVRQQLQSLGYDNEDIVVVLCADGQLEEEEATFAYRDDSKFQTQTALMAISDIHFGNPGSSVDMGIAHWRQGKAMFPAECFQDFVEHS
eukprot:CAMPEP_0183718496 /NCGR_PEP_ID=MMETSP0737-20130205/11735_1 /TAXON_ID=385413 /ORGANISM="Thalassiosira miniscula, Strain CCMP1093" /LENGTH=477 /DNA_ID=CAMNT_0025948059 /DNA_START=57 /DNA_END=1487 /DNA_ORIENTATION=-